VIYTGCAGQSFPGFSGKTELVGTDDVMRYARAADALVLEAHVNAIGQAEAALGGEPGPRYLAGIQLAGAGQGRQFLVAMLFSREGQPPGNEFARSLGAGLRAFFYGGETAEALGRSKQLALGRAREFVGQDLVGEYRGFELAGSSDGTVYLGMFLVNRTAPNFLMTQAPTISSWLNLAGGSVEVHWGDGSADTYGAGWSNITHAYVDGEPIHLLRLVGEVTQVTDIMATTEGLLRVELGDLSGLLLLYVGGNQLRQLDLSPVPLLQEVDVFGNALRELDCSPCPGMLHVFAFENQLRSVNVTGCVLLDSLDCYTNELTSLDVTTCADLEELYCGENPLTQLDLSACADLTVLWCDGAQLAGVDLTSNLLLIDTYLPDNAMPQAEVDATLASIAGNLGLRPGAADLDVNGTNAAPSIPDGCLDYNAIVAHGWTVTITGSCPP
jgi:hypothetical protein